MGSLLFNIYLINILEKVQIEAMRMISGGTKLTPLKELYKETGLLKLKDRWENHKLIQLFKIQNSSCWLFMTRDG
jgi:hypothetical protein